MGKAEVAKWQAGRDNRDDIGSKMIRTLESYSNTQRLIYIPGYALMLVCVKLGWGRGVQEST